MKTLGIILLILIGGFTGHCSAVFTIGSITLPKAPTWTFGPCCPSPSRAS